MIAELLTSASPEESKYIIKTILFQLRAGVGEGSLRDAVVWAFFGKKLGIDFHDKESKNEPEDREEYKRYQNAVQHAYDLSNDFGKVAQAAASGKLEELESIDLQIGSPIKVMLAIKVNSIEEGIKRVGSPAEVEVKYDGFRVQIHKDTEGTITLFTRRLEDVSRQFPENCRFGTVARER